MYKPGRRALAAAFGACVLLGALGVWVLLHPASIFVQPWRAQTTQSPAKDVIFGPYPVEADFVALRQRGVTTIVSLLNPDLPYERVLLDEERERAARHGMTVRNFPMGSILGQKFGADYARNAQAAAEAALSSRGVAYIHCYLGLHRARSVQDYLAAHARTRSYGGSTAIASAADLDNEHAAQTAFDAQDYAGSLAALQRIQARGLRAQRLEAWNYYRLRRLPEARAGFEAALRTHPDDADSLSGLAYVSLADDRLDAAEQAFTRVLALQADEASAVQGLAHVRYRQGRHDDARRLFEQVLAQDPGNPEARQMLDHMRELQRQAAGAAGTPAAAP